LNDVSEVLSASIIRALIPEDSHLRLVVALTVLQVFVFDGCVVKRKLIKITFNSQLTVPL
jgi:hypothetical protein